jgi:thiamine biosynthesis lipoprotein
MCVLEIENKAVITSGNYERYFTDDEGNMYWHIIDKNDGYPADNGLVSVTIIGEDGLHCDALSTALFVEGTENAVAHWRQSNDFEMILVTDDNRIIISDGIQDSFTNQSTMPVEVVTHE